METRIDSPSGPDYEHETALIRTHGGPVAGVDEAGRGPLAGPVVAAAVILDPDNIPAGMNDSKLLGEQIREALFDTIMDAAIVGVGIADVDRIDHDNILQATFWAMTQACSVLRTRPSAVLIDGNSCPRTLSCPAQPLIRGDALSLSVAAASIIAKVTRDRIMRDLARDHAVYGWERNKGYGTREHSAALMVHGVTVHHRRSFRPIRALIEQDAKLKTG